MVVEDAVQSQRHSPGHNVGGWWSVRLTTDQLDLLALGPKYCPTPRSLDRQRLSQDVTEGCRRIRLKELYHDPDKLYHDPDKLYHDPDKVVDSVPPRFYMRTGYVAPSGRDKALDAYCDTLQSRTDVYQSSRRPHDNLSPELKTALRELREMVTKRIVRISPADKGGAVVVQDAANYVSEANRQLQNERHYSKLKKDPTLQIAKTSNELVNRLHIDGHIDDITCRWALVKPNNVRCHQFHLLPKIHKTLTNPPGRPIVSCVNGPTESLSKLVDHWLQGHVASLSSHVKDTTHMLRTLQQWNHDYGPFRDGVRLVTIDVIGLYTNIPHQDLLTALRFHLNSMPQTNIPPTERIVDIAHHVLSSNVFSFEEDYFQQIFSTAMGTPMAPSAANLFMGWLEAQVLASSPAPVSQDTWKRFIDDIFLLWTHHRI